MIHLGLVLFANLYPGQDGDGGVVEHPLDDVHPGRQLLSGLALHPELEGLHPLLCVAIPSTTRATHQLGFPRQLQVTRSILRKLNSRPGQTHQVRCDVLELLVVDDQPGLAHRTPELHQHCYSPPQPRHHWETVGSLVENVHIPRTRSKNSEFLPVRAAVLSQWQCAVAVFARSKDKDRISSKSELVVKRTIGQGNEVQFSWADTT